jgi:4-amino-4-deoxy-L-arabinose transferase-like glycosyltransferase
MDVASAPGSERAHRSRVRVLTVALAFAAAALAVRLLYRSAYDASDLRITPDEVEYAVCARRLAMLGRYDLPIDGALLPPYSTPWFAALLAPAYWFGAHAIGAGIFVVLAFAVLGVLAAQRIGTLVGGAWGGTLAAIALVALPLYPYVARVIMTDAPAAALALVAAWLFLRREAHVASVRDFAVVGCVIACAFALRSPYLALVTPFAWRALRARSRRSVRIAALFAPAAVVVVANALYNHVTFGDWRRTGYEFWCAVPYDYADLLMSPSYVARSVRDLAVPATRVPFLLGAAGAIVLWMKRPPLGRELLGFAAATALPISIVQLFYFYSSQRFHAYSVALCLLIAGAGTASALPERSRAHPRAEIGALLLLAIACVVLQPFDIQAPSRRRAADLIQSETPRDAVVISGLEPVYLAELDDPASSRTYLAISRNVEFADKVLVPARIDRELVEPKSAFDHAARGLLEHGARRAVARTADEMHDEIDAWVRAGRPVFLETGFLPDPNAIVRLLGASLRPEQTGTALTRLVPAH